MQQKSLYRPELDVLRFCAFFFVFLHHLLPREAADVRGLAPALGDFVIASTQALGFGMTLFFFLSAFLITRLLVAEMETSGKIGIVDFYARRALRIWPLYVLGICLGVVLTGGPQQDEINEMFVWYSLFLGNWFFVAHDWNINPMAPLWSISVEEQFYLVLPIVLTLVGPGRVLRLGVGAMVAGLVSLWWQGERHLAIDTAIWVNTTTHFLAFGTGIALAVWSMRRPFEAKWFVRVALGLLGLAALWLGAGVFDGKRIADARSGFDVVAGHGSAVLGCVGLLLALLDAQLRFPRWLIHLGQISFGLYVFHVTAIRVVESLPELGLAGRIGGAFAITVLLALISYHFFEVPFLMLKRRFERVASRPI